MGKVAKESISFCNSKEMVPEQDRKKRLIEISKLLNESIKRGEEKFALAKSTYDAVDRHCTRLDNDLNKYEDEQLIGPSRAGRNPSGTTTTSTTTTTVQQPSAATLKRSKSSIKKGRKGRKKKQEPDQDQQGDYISREDALRHAQTAINLSELPIDPNEPVYCTCRMVSYGEMVACDNDEVSGNKRWGYGKYISGWIYDQPIFFLFFFSLV
ncbi:unnamed protein product [Absidia cylindrospora]